MASCLHFPVPWLSTFPLFRYTRKAVEGSADYFSNHRCHGQRKNRALLLFGGGGAGVKGSGEADMSPNERRGCQNPTTRESPTTVAQGCCLGKLEMSDKPVQKFQSPERTVLELR